MASMTIRNLNDDIKRRLRIRAAERGHSMEEEVREILRMVLIEQHPPGNLADAISACFEPLGGVELELPPRRPMRDPPSFD